LLALPDIPVKLNRSQRLRQGLVLAFTAHLLLLAALPDIPNLELKWISRDGGINVFLNKSTKPKEKAFQQSLNQPSPQPVLNQTLVDPATGSATPNPGDESQVTESAPQVDAQLGESKDQEAQGKKTNLGIQRNVFISRAMINQFTQQQAVLYANKKPDDLERFRRTFNSYRSYQRRNQRQSYKSLYGDYYAKSSSSVGDVCFKQERDGVQDEFSTKTVYFFRCDSKPKKFKVDLKTNPES